MSILEEMEGIDINKKIVIKQGHILTKSLKNSDEILALTRIDFVSIAFFILVDFYDFLKVPKLKTGGVEMLRSSLRENLLMSWQGKK